MAERSYNGRLLNTNPTMAGTGSTTTVNSWIGNASQGWGVAQTSPGTITECTYTTYLTEDCIKLSVTGMARSGASTGQLGIANTSKYPGPTLSPSDLSGIAEKVEEGKQYKISCRYFIDALAADTGSMRFTISRTWYNSNGTRLVAADSTPDTTVSTSWETYETTVTAPAGAAYLVIRANFLPNADPTTNGSGTVYVSDFRVTEVLPARTTATSRLVARDMGTALRFDGVANRVANTSTPTGLSQGCSFRIWIQPTRLDVSQTIFCATEASNSRIVARLGTNGRVDFGFYNGTAYTRKNCPAGKVLVNNPALLHGSWDGTTVRLYVNGIEYTGNTNDPATAASIGVYVGVRADGVDPFQGIKDEPTLWIGKVITPAEVAADYFCGTFPSGKPYLKWLFDEATGTTAIDSSGNGNNGTISGATYTADVPLKPRVAVRDMGTALSFDGVDDFVFANAPDCIVQGGAWSFDMFVRIPLSDGMIFASRQNTTNRNFAMGWRSSTKRIEGAFFTAGAPNTYRGRFGSISNALTAGSVVRITVVYEGKPLNEGTNGVRFHVNSIQQPANSQNFGSAGNTDRMSFGAKTEGSNFYAGTIDEPRIWNRALTATEIQNLYLHNIVPQDGLVAEYLFDEATGTTAIDSSGNGNNGTISGATYTTDTPLQKRGSV